MAAESYSADGAFNPARRLQTFSATSDLSPDRFEMALICSDTNRLFFSSSWQIAFSCLDYSSDIHPSFLIKNQARPRGKHLQICGATTPLERLRRCWY
jgi:hypothetical protein